MTDRKILEAAASLTAEDIEYVKSHCGSQKDRVPAEPRQEASTTQQSEEEPASSAEAPQPDEAGQQRERAKGGTTNARMQRKSRRSHIDHAWPEVGTILEADYFGTHYTAEIIPAPRGRKLKSGKLIRITSGSAAGTEHISMSGAMEAATQHQRDEQALGRKGCLSGWDFWRREEKK